MKLEIEKDYIASLIKIKEAEHKKYSDAIDIYKQKGSLLFRKYIKLTNEAYGDLQSLLRIKDVLEEQEKKEKHNV